MAIDIRSKNHVKNHLIIRSMIVDPDSRLNIISSSYLIYTSN